MQSDRKRSVDIGFWLLVLLAFVLAPMLEENMRKAFIASRGSLGIFADSPLKLVLLAVFLVLVLTPTVKAIRRKMGAGKKTPV